MRHVVRNTHQKNVPSKLCARRLLPSFEGHLVCVQVKEFQCIPPIHNMPNLIQNQPIAYFCVFTIFRVFSTFFFLAVRAQYRFFATNPKYPQKISCSS